MNMRNLCLLGPVMAVAALPLMPAAAQDDLPPPIHLTAAAPAPYVALVTAINSGVDKEVTFGRALDQIRIAVLAGNSEIAALEAENPGVLDAMMSAMAPILRRHSERVTVDFEQATARLLARHLTRAEASDAAAFYNSALGRRVLVSIQNNIRFDAIARDAVAAETDGGAGISTASVADDLAQGSRDAVSELSAADMALMDRIAADASWLPKFGAVQSQIIALRAEMENAPMTAADDAAMQSAIADAVEAFLSGAAGA